MKKKLFTQNLRFFWDSILFRRLEKKTGSPNNASDSQEFERCVMCGALTSIPVSMPIDMRNNYEIGLGQVCDKCANKLQEYSYSEDGLLNAQIMQAVKYRQKETSNKK